MPADIVLLAVIAIVVLLWLKNTVGTRSDSDEARKKPNPYSENYKEPQKPSSAKKEGAGQKDSEGPAEKVITMATRTPEHHPDVENKTAEVSLVKISIADKNFDIDTFLYNARQAFEIIVTAFAKGDRGTLKNLTNEEVYDAFDAIITEREEKNQKAETKIHDISRSEIIEASLKGNIATLTVRFKVLETHVTRDADDKVIFGDPNKKVQLIDVWVFSRDVKDKDPRWWLVETRDDHEEEDEATPLPKNTAKKSKKS